MWIGLLTAAAHPSRADGDDEAVTLFAWGREERLRIDGPLTQLVSGLRSVRGHAVQALGAPYAPRCFACRDPYPLPFPDVIRARADAGDVDADDPAAVIDPVAAEWPVSRSDQAAAAPGDTVRNAVFLLVHVDEDAPAGKEGEAVVVVAGTNLALLVPFDALGQMVEVVAAACADEPLPLCERCGGPVPGGAIGAQAPAAGPSRAQRRRDARSGAVRRRAA